MTKPSFRVYYCICNTEDWSLGLTYTRQAFYQWTIPYPCFSFRGRSLPYIAQVGPTLEILGLGLQGIWSYGCTPSYSSLVYFIIFLYSLDWLCICNSPNPASRGLYSRHKSPHLIYILFHYQPINPSDPLVLHSNNHNKLLEENFVCTEHVQTSPFVTIPKTCNIN